MRTPIRLALAGCAVALGLSVGSGPANAAECAPESVSASGARADAVFTGSVTTRLVSPRGKLPRTVSYQVAVEDVFKGGPLSPPVTVVARLNGDAAAPALKADQRYAFFVTAAPSGDYRLAGPCTGTRPVTVDVLTALDAAFPPPTPTPEPTPQPVTRTVVETTGPLEFTRLAAPGAALFLLGGLGLGVIRLLNRDE